MHTLKKAAIYTTYNPDINFINRIKCTTEFCDIVVVVDNTPGGATLNLLTYSNVYLLSDGINKGLGGALNAGISKAFELGCRSFVLFDQDSSPSTELLEKLFLSLKKLGKQTIVAPTFEDDSKHIASSGLSYEGAKLVKCVATSGLAFNIHNNTMPLSFSTELFLDFVDFDWCWRMNNQGWFIYRLCGLNMPHRLGLSQNKFLGFTYHVPHPFRHYYQFRDTLHLTARPYVPIYSKWRLRLILIPKILLYPFIMDNGFERLKWMLTGIKDWFNGVFGSGAAKRVVG